MKADLAMAIHFHQPVGNLDHVVNRVCDNCYLPFLKTLQKYPGIRMTLHFTGSLLEWVENKRPEIIKMTRKLAEAGQVELMGGGFYEPVLSSIPPADRARQLDMMNGYINSTFKCKPLGAWVAERVWEPELASVFHDAGMKYVILDDTHLIYAGIPKSETYGYYVTEDNAKGVFVFPSDKALRYMIPYKLPFECVDHMRYIASNVHDPIFIYGDDGEKFGEWPGSHEWVFKEKWLEKFLDEVMKNTAWLETVTLSECLKNHPSKGKVYLPTASYDEMSEWALPAESQRRMGEMLTDLRQSGREESYRPFIRGGFWRNFLTKYPESDHMNKKMIYVSRKFEDFTGSEAAGKVGEEGLRHIEKELLRGQCNCAYWHGMFGGLYLFHLRRAVYDHLIKSEAMMDKMIHNGEPFCKAEVLDMNADGFKEVIMENRELSLYLSPAAGGVLKELDSKAVCTNLVNSLARTKEAYHEQILRKIFHKDQFNGAHVPASDRPVRGLIDEHMSYDWYGRGSLIDHFFSENITIKDFSKCDYHEAGDFVKGIYEFEIEQSADEIILAMKRKGMAGGHRVALTKKIILPREGAFFQVKYGILNMEEKPVSLIFAPEFNLTMPEADSELYSVTSNNDEGKASSLSDVSVHDDADRLEVSDAGKSLSVELSLSEKSCFWHMPVKTVSQSETAYELNYQSSAIVPLVKFALEAKREKTFDMKVKLAY